MNTNNKFLFQNNSATSVQAINLQNVNAVVLPPEVALYSEFLSEFAFSTDLLPFESCDLTLLSAKSNDITFSTSDPVQLGKWLAPIFDSRLFTALQCVLSEPREEHRVLINLSNVGLVKYDADTKNRLYINFLNGRRMFLNALDKNDLVDDMHCLTQSEGDYISHNFNHAHSSC